MKKTLIRKSLKLYYIDHEGVEHVGSNPNMSGDCSGLIGNCTGLIGDCSNLIGDCSRLWGICSGLIGDCSDLEGDCSGLEGDLDRCELTKEERIKGVDINELVGE